MGSLVVDTPRDLHEDMRNKSYILHTSFASEVTNSDSDSAHENVQPTVEQTNAF